MSNRQDIFWISIVLLIAYCGPAIILVYYYVFESAGRFDRADPIPVLILSIATSQQQALALIHRILLPAITFLSTISLADKEAASKRSWLTGITIILLIIAIGTQVYFDYSTANIRQGVETAKELALIDALFTRISETFGVYLALLLGLKVAETK